MARKEKNGGMSRRLFVRRCAEGCVVCALPVVAGGCGAKGGVVNQAPLPPTGIFPEMPVAAVGMAGVRSSIFKAVEEAVEASGGLAEIGRGQRVMIKPNMTGPAIWGKYPPGPITTNPEVLRAVVRLVKQRGAHPLVGDRAMLWDDFSFKSTGFAKVCAEEKAEAFLWKNADYVWFRSGKRHWSHGFRIPRILGEADHFINLPVLKNHEATNAEFTCCLKSFVGVCHPEDRHQKGADNLHLENIGEKIAELNLAAAPLINIVDATTIMTKGGPGAGIAEGDVAYKDAQWEDANLIIASRDRVACDAVGLAVLKRYAAERNIKRPYVDKSVRDQVQIYYAAELGLGQADPANINIENVKAPLVDEFKANL